MITMGFGDSAEFDGETHVRQGAISAGVGNLFGGSNVYLGSG